MQVRSKQKLSQEMQFRSKQKLSQEMQVKITQIEIT